MTHAHILWLIGLIVATTISAWITAIFMRRRIRRALGKKDVSDVELTSLKTWIDVADSEERRRGGTLS